MKVSEKLKQKGNAEENDLKAMGIYTKALREGRSERFEDKWLEKLEKKVTMISKTETKYTFSCEQGIIDFFPKANKLLIRKRNKWVKPGLKYIITKILK